MQVPAYPIPNLADVAESVRQGRCILFLGAMASAPSPAGCPYTYRTAPPGGAELSRRLARACNYPYDDTWNLLRVSLYYQIQTSRSRLVEAIQREITGCNAPDGTGRIEYDPSPALHMLAALPFPIIITTNYDRLFDRALKRALTLDGREKDPIVKVYNPDGAPEYVTLDPSERNPVLLKLHGDIENRDSIVVTEEDYLCFIEKMSNEKEHPIHLNIRSRINTWPVLFIGYSLKDYNLRLLYRTMRWYLDPATLPLSYSIDPYPDQLIVSIFQEMVRFVEDDLWKFVPALYEAVTGRAYPP
ncbi:SIR2 family protein [Rhodocaloribacter litoris]|uniref:SIR2 family protein n=1 Tax=Rhodocaloribacter litoris TaxID=2558931 RepID=UPI0014207620|nr:SIR2 family protein [Rhodocaloribacter litoris]QXD14562.1 SIR2 family protein [Rhodocaloribacter litoris]